MTKKVSSLDRVQKILDSINEKYGAVVPAILAVTAVIIYLFILRFFLYEALNVL